MLRVHVCAIIGIYWNSQIGSTKKRQQSKLCAYGGRQTGFFASPCEREFFLKPTILRHISRELREINRTAPCAELCSMLD